MFQVALFTPRIPPNTGNIIRLIANNNCLLHLIEPLGFDLGEKNLRRAGLDYADLNRVKRHADYEAFTKYIGSDARVYAISTKGTERYDKVSYKRGDCFLFGSETSGLPPDIMQYHRERDRLLRIPMISGCRSMNLSNSVAVVTYEAWRQVGFEGGS